MLGRFFASQIFGAKNHLFWNASKCYVLLGIQGLDVSFEYPWDSLGSQKISEPGPFLHDFHWMHMNVSKNSGFSPQIIPILIGVFPLFSPSILGETPLFFGNIHMHPVGHLPTQHISWVRFLQHMLCTKDGGKNPPIGMSIRSWCFTTSNQAGLLKQAIIIREHEAGIGTIQGLSNPSFSNSWRFQFVGHLHEQFSTWAHLNSAMFSPPKRPFSFKELSKKSEEKFIPKVLPPNWSNRLYIKGALRFLIIHLFSHRVILTGPCSSLCGRVGLPGPSHHVPGNTPGSFERASRSYFAQIEKYMHLVCVLYEHLYIYI